VLVVEAVMVDAAMVNARDVPPHTGVRMPFHMDSDKGRVRDEKGYSTATAIWMQTRLRRFPHANVNCLVWMTNKLHGSYRPR
jgi:hypothetical protein